MTSTSSRICTGFVPESIISSIAAGQGSGARYRSLLLMKRTTAFADQRERGETAADQPVQLPGSTAAYRGLPGSSVPDLYRRPLRRRLADAAALERIAQDRAWQWTRLFRDDLRREIETGVSSPDWDDQGVTPFSRMLTRRSGVTR